LDHAPAGISPFVLTLQSFGDLKSA